MDWVRRLALVLVLAALLGAKGPEVFFAMQDPAGDDYGPGSYLYPRNIAFEPYKGLFDLLEFRVWREDPRTVYFDMKMAKIVNPWAAPEGFIHPVIHIYIDSRPGGQIVPATPGPDVRFAPEYGWEYCLIAAGWGNSRLITFDESNEIISEKLEAQLIGDGRTIRLTVPATLLGVPDRQWRYCVLVGSYDGFGPGLFRDVRRQEGEWAFGGGLDRKGEPRVLDLLAPARGRLSQENLLRFDPAKQETAALYPVGHGLTSGFRWWRQAAWATLFVLILGTLLWRWRRGKILVFWHSMEKEPAEKGQNPL